MKRKKLYSVIGFIFLSSLLLFPLSAEAIPSLGVAPAIGEYGIYYGPPDDYLGVFADEFVSGEGGFQMPSSGDELSIWYGGKEDKIDLDSAIWLLTTSAAGEDFSFGGEEFDIQTFTVDESIEGFYQDVNPDLDGLQYYGLNLGSITEINPLLGNLGLAWESLTLGEFDKDKWVFYFLTGTIDYTGFEDGDWMFAYIPNTGGSSPQETSATSATVVPEPSTVLLIGTGLIGLGIFRRRFRKS